MHDCLIVASGHVYFLDYLIDGELSSISTLPVGWSQETELEIGKNSYAVGRQFHWVVRPGIRLRDPIPRRFPNSFVSDQPRDSFTAIDHQMILQLYQWQAAAPQLPIHPLDHFALLRLAESVHGRMQQDHPHHRHELPEVVHEELDTGRSR